MSHKRARRDIAAGVVTAGGAFLGGVLISLANAATANADEGSPLDQMIDNSYQAIANFWAPEAGTNVFTADMFSDLFTGEGNAADQMVDNLYQMIATAFAPEGSIDVFLDPLLGISPF
jgi:hypothetical protein